MSVQKRTTKTGRVSWIARYRDNTGKEHSKSFKTQREAKAYIQEQQRALRRGEWADPQAGGVVLRELAEFWATQANNPGTRHIRGHLMRNLGDLADIPLRSLDAPMVRAWLGVLRDGRPWAGGRGLSLNTRTSLLGQLNAMLNQAVGDGVLVRNPASRVRVERASVRVVPGSVPSPQQVAAMILEAGGGDLGVLVQVLAATGMRANEACGLSWRNVDFGNKIISVVEQATTDGMGTRPLKTGDSGMRAVHVDDMTLQALDSLPRNLDGRCFHTPTGLPFSGHRLLAAMHRAGWAWTPKDLRHFHATQLLSRGVSIKVVQQRLGHATATKTLDVYAHFLPSDGEKAAVVAGEFFAGFLREPPRKMHAS